MYYSGNGEPIFNPNYNISFIVGIPVLLLECNLLLSDIFLTMLSQCYVDRILPRLLQTTLHRFQPIFYSPLKKHGDWDQHQYITLAILSFQKNKYCYHKCRRLHPHQQIYRLKDNEGYLQSTYPHRKYCPSILIFLFVYIIQTSADFQYMKFVSIAYKIHIS